MWSGDAGARVGGEPGGGREWQGKVECVDHAGRGSGKGVKETAMAAILAAIVGEHVALFRVELKDIGRLCGWAAFDVRGTWTCRRTERAL